VTDAFQAPVRPGSSGRTQTASSSNVHASNCSPSHLSPKDLDQKLQARSVSLQTHRRTDSTMLHRDSSWLLVIHLSRQIYSNSLEELIQGLWIRQQLPTRLPHCLTVKARIPAIHNLPNPRDPEVRQRPKVIKIRQFRRTPRKTHPNPVPLRVLSYVAWIGIPQKSGCPKRSRGSFDTVHRTKVSRCARTDMLK